MRRSTADLPPSPTPTEIVPSSGSRGKAARGPAPIKAAALLFDLDGVLIDSLPAVERVWRGWALERGFDPEAVLAHAHGRPSLATVTAFLPNANHAEENLEVERREVADTADIVPLTGAAELLRELEASGARWAIVTACTRPLAEARLRAAGLPLPACLVTSSDVERGKPAPDGYLAAAHRLGCAAASCIVVEDRPPGVRAGTAAGVRVIGVTTSLDAAELIAAGATWTVANCAEIVLANLHPACAAGARLTVRLK